MTILSAASALSKPVRADLTGPARADLPPSHPLPLHLIPASPGALPAEFWPDVPDVYPDECPELAPADEFEPTADDLEFHRATQRGGLPADARNPHDLPNWTISAWERWTGLPDPDDREPAPSLASPVGSDLDPDNTPCGLAGDFGHPATEDW